MPPAEDGKTLRAIAYDCQRFPKRTVECMCAVTLAPLLAGRPAPLKCRRRTRSLNLLAEQISRLSMRAIGFARWRSCWRFGRRGFRASSRLGYRSQPNRCSQPTAKSPPLCTIGSLTRCIRPSRLRGLPSPASLVKRETFAPLAQENAGSLAQIGYFTTLKLDGKAVGIWACDRVLDGGAAGPSCGFSCRAAAENSDSGGQFCFAAGRRSRIFH